MRLSSLPCSCLLRVVVLLVAGSLLVACGGDSPATSTVTPTEATTTVTPLGVGQGTAIPTAENTPVNMLKLVLWWPEALAPADLPNVTDLLDQQIAAFGTSEETYIDIEFRLKRYLDVGGIMATLRTANAVAPGALPDLTLLRREELVSAVQNQLIYPLEGLVSSAVIGDLYDSTLALGQVDGQIYGLPYTVDVLHLAYNAALMTGGEASSMPSQWSFEEMLENRVPLVFPAGRVNGVNSTFYLQYLNAGGTPPRSDGTMRLNEDALRVTLEFYERAYEQGLIGGQVFEYVSVGDYISALTLGEITAAVIDSNHYLDLRAEGRLLQPGLIPTATGQPTSIVNGWMWVLTTNNADQQKLVARFLNWMMDANSQREYAAAIHMLPSQRAALQGMHSDLVDVDMMDGILMNAIIPPPENAGGITARAMQSALNAVLTGTSTAEEAVRTVVEQTTN